VTRRTRFTVLLTVCLALFAIAGAAQAATATKLLAKYQPVTYFDQHEQFRPTTVETFIADSTLERFNPATGTFVIVDPDPHPDTLPSSGAGWRLNQQGCNLALGLAGEACYAAAWSSHDAPGTVYGRVVRTDNRVVIQYWYFYYDDFYSYTSPPSDTIWQTHEGDWEVVSVVLNADEVPLYVGYSQHCLGERRAWSKTPRREGHHPVVYVALGSHANYFEPGTHPWNRTCLPQPVIDFFTAAGLSLPDDHMSAENAPAAGPASFGAEETAVQRVNSSSPSWLAFPGTWGEFQLLHAPGILQPSGLSPVGPAQHDVWADPLATLATWPAG
jgi:hypothetical protein